MSTTTEAEILDPSELAEAKEYNRAEFRCDLLDRGIDLAYLSLASFLLAIPLDHWLLARGWEQRTMRLCLMYAIITLLHMVVSFPLSLYSGHLLEHRYQLSRQTFGGWLWRYFKRNLITLLMGTLLTVVLYQIIWRTGPLWWLVAAAAYFGLSILLGQLAPVLLLPLFYKIERCDDAAMQDRFGKLAQGTGLSLEGVYRMSMSDETAKANAMLAGLGATRRVILGDTLLDGFEANEIDVIFAHEVGHHVHRHVTKLIAIGLAYSLAGFFVCDQLIHSWVLQHSDTMSYADLPVYTLPLLTLVTTIFFMLVEPVQNALSRHFERQADTYALERTHDVPAYRSAFKKLARLNKADPDPHPWEVFLFHSHPPIAARLRMADAFAAREISSP